MKMDIRLNILTLNCWDIVGVSRHRKERMMAIAEHIANSKYDFVFLQEVWNKADYEMIHKKTFLVLPYSFYFHSGVLGSGVCILSQSAIRDVAQYKFTLNGYPHKIHHGDWFGGKVVGLCKVRHYGLNINLYTTHLHAEYDNFCDSYLPHRIVQAFEMSQFVQMTSETADLSIIAGDLNTEPCDLPYRLIVHNGGCIDSFLMQAEVKKNPVVNATCGHPDNLYTSKKELKTCPDGKRIDYIMYKCGQGTSVNCVNCCTPLGKIADSPIPYSDHEAVVAQLHVFRTVNAPQHVVDQQQRFEAISSAHDILAVSLKNVNRSRYYYMIVCSMIFLVLSMSALFKGKSGMLELITFVQIVCSVCLTYFLWLASVMNRIEYSGMLSACKSMSVLKNALTSEYESQIPKKDFESPKSGSHGEITL